MQQQPMMQQPNYNQQQPNYPQQVQQPNYFPSMGYNPYFTNQQRLQQMEQMYPHLNPNNYQQPVQQSSTPTLKGRAVTGIDEAKASTIDFDGSIHLFTDIANGNIYTKQIGLNGLAEFNTYTLQPKEVKPVPEVAAIAKPIQEDEINKLTMRIQEMETRLKKYEEAILNEYNANNANVAGKRKPNANANAIRAEQPTDADGN